MHDFNCTEADDLMAERTRYLNYPNFLIESVIYC